MLIDYKKKSIVCVIIRLFLPKITTFLPKFENCLGFLTLDLQKTFRIFGCCWKIVFCRETMIFRANMHWIKVVQNAISYIFVLLTSSPRLHRFRDFWRFLFFLEFPLPISLLSTLLRQKTRHFCQNWRHFCPKIENSLDFELRSSKIPYFRLFSCWEANNR